MGCANFAQRSAIPAFQAAADRFELVSVASRSEEKSNRFAAEFSCKPVVGYENLVVDPELDLIYMPLPTALHDEWVSRCLDHGKHLIVEKSMAENLNSARKMIESAKRNKRLLAENFMFKHHRQIGFVKDLINKQEIGRVQQIRSSFGFPPLPKDNFRFNKSLGGGALLDAGAYTLQAAQLFLGPETEVKSASLVDTMRYGVDTLGAVHLADQSGVSALLGFGFENFYQCNFEIWGTEGKITATRAFTAKPDFSPEVIVEKQGSRDVHKIPPDDQFQNFLLAIHDSLIENQLESFLDNAERQAKLLSSVFEAAKK